jgi:hypothetical protein
MNPLVIGRSGWTDKAARPARYRQGMIFNRPPALRILSHRRERFPTGAPEEACYVGKKVPMLRGYATETAPAR